MRVLPGVRQAFVYSVLWYHTCHDQKHGKTLADRAPQEHLASANVLDEPVGAVSAEGVDSNVNTTENKREITVQTETVFEDNWREVDDCVATTNLGTQG